MLPYETKNQMKSLREMIGPHAIHSLRDEKPLTNDTKTLRGRNSINIVIGSNEPKFTPFEFGCDRRCIGSYYDRNDTKFIFLVRYEGIQLKGSNFQERNDEFMSEIMHCIQIDEDNDAGNYYFIDGVFDFPEYGIDVVCEISEVYSNYVVASNAMTALTKRFDNNETIAMLVKQRLE